jgi:hypothetical protein
MQSRNSWVLGGAIVLGALILGVSLAPRTAAQRADLPLPGQVPGRYQVTHAARAHDRGGLPQADLIVVTDTVSGHSWVAPAEPEGTWHDLGSPLQPKK